jgi:hypothetical protein
VLGALVRRTCPPARAGGAEYVPVPAEEEDERWRERTRSQLFAATAGSKPASHGFVDGSVRREELGG